MGTAGWIILLLAILIMYLLVTGKMTGILKAIVGKKKGG